MTFPEISSTLKSLIFSYRFHCFSLITKCKCELRCIDFKYQSNLAPACTQSCTKQAVAGYHQKMTGTRQMQNEHDHNEVYRGVGSVQMTGTGSVGRRGEGPGEHAPHHPGSWDHRASHKLHTCQ